MEPREAKAWVGDQPVSEVVLAEPHPASRTLGLYGEKMPDRRQPTLLHEIVLGILVILIMVQFFQCTTLEQMSRVNEQILEEMRLLTTPIVPVRPKTRPESPDEYSNGRQH